MIGKRRKKKRMRKEQPSGDPQGVARAEEELAISDHALRRDQKTVIEPLRHEAYKNNIQELVERLLGHQGGRRRDSGASAH